MRIVLADDHDVVCAGLRQILEKMADVVVVGEATTGREAVAMARDCSADLVVTDMSMPDLNGLEAARQILAADAQIKVIVLSMYEDSRYIMEALKLGASAYVLKNSASGELPQAIRAAMEGKTFLSPRVAHIVVEGCVRRTPSDDPSAASLLSSREREVLQLLSEGKTSKQIAAVLNVSTKTVESHRGQITSKLGIRTIAALTKFAIREGITALEQ